MAPVIEPFHYPSPDNLRQIKCLWESQQREKRLATIATTQEKKFLLPSLGRFQHHCCYHYNYKLKARLKMLSQWMSHRTYLALLCRKIHAGDFILKWRKIHSFQMKKKDSMKTHRWRNSKQRKYQPELFLNKLFCQKVKYINQFLVLLED